MSEPNSREVAEAIREEAKLDGATTANPQLEATILGVCLRDVKTFETAKNILRPADFTTRQHKSLWDVLDALATQSIAFNSVTVTAELTSRGELRAFGGEEAVRGYFLNVSGIGKEINSYCQQLRNFTLARKQRHTGMKLEKLSHATVTMAERVEQTRALVTELEGYAISTKQSERLCDVIDRMGIEKFLDPTLGTTFLKTPWISYNNLIVGYQPGTINLIGAYSSQGKSMAAGCIALHNALLDIPVAFFSLEMLGEDVFRRMCCNLAGVSSMKMLKGTLDHDERTRLQQAVAKLHEKPLYVQNLDGYTVSDVRREVERLQNKDVALKMFVIDHIHKMRPAGRVRDLREAYTLIAQDLGAYVRESQLACLCLAQLRKGDVKNEARRPTMQDVREAAAITDEAFSCTMLWRPDFYKPGGNRELTHVYVDKHRNGPTGHFDLLAQDKYFRFNESQKSIDDASNEE